MLVSEWVQGHGTSCHLQVTADLYAQATKDVHILTLSVLSLATTGVTGTLQTPYYCTSLLYTNSLHKAALYILLITGSLIEQFSVVCFVIMVE